MTDRPTDRRIERRLDDLESGAGVRRPETVEAWASQELREALQSGDIEASLGDDATPTELVRVVAPQQEAAFGLELSLEPAAIPDWVDVDDLPVRRGGTVQT